ncbi:sensor domain-containing diguanylate cyclase, partial [Magnetovibrio blakemorei]
MQRFFSHILTQSILACLTYYGLAQLAISTTIMPEGIAIFWPPNAVIVAALILSRPRHWIWFVGAGIIGEFLADFGHFPIWQIAGFALVNALEATLTAFFIRFVLLRGKSYKDISIDLSLGMVGVFLFVSPPIAALCGAAIYELGDESISYWAFWRVWWFGDAIGLLLITPFLLAWLTRDERALIHWRTQFFEIVASAAATLLLSAVVFLSPASWPYWTGMPSLLLPLIAYLAIRFGQRGATAALVVIAFTAAFGATNELGAFTHIGTQAETVVAMQEFLLTAAILAFFLSTSFRQLSIAIFDLKRERALLEERVRERTQSLSDAKVRAEILAHTDVLTDINNRRSFIEKGEYINKQAKRFGQSYSIIMLDVDRFKDVNDTYGHEMGDAALTLIGNIIKDTIRTVDIAGRIGGEEFAICLPDTKSEFAVVLAERLRTIISETPVIAHGQTVFLTISLGVSTY